MAARKTKKRRSKKLYGAALAAHKKRVSSGKRKARKNPAPKRKVRRVTKTKRAVSKKRVRRNPTPKRKSVSALKRKVSSIDSRLHKVEKKVKKVSHALEGTKALGRALTR